MFIFCSDSIVQNHQIPENSFLFFSIDYDTDEETDKLLGLEHQFHSRNQAIRDAVVKPSRSREGIFNDLLLQIPILSLFLFY